MRTRMMAGLLALLFLASSPACAVEAVPETLWIFDADFEDLQGDNAGWVSKDISGTLGQQSYWHKDTIRINGFMHLGDSTWWCGTTNPCWRQPRGYGNNWYQLMRRDFPLSEWSEPGDAVALEWDQRFAVEHDYDYAYVDVSTDGGVSWSTLASFCNPGFPGKPGLPQDWDSPYGQCDEDLSPYAGQDVVIRFRFDSDLTYSAQDQYVNTDGSVVDGAWQIDNITWNVNGTAVWIDDCEAPGENGWEHEAVLPAGQTGVVFRRSLESVMGYPSWMMVAYDEVSGLLVDDQDSALLTPPIDILGADALYAEMYGYINIPPEAGDRAALWVAAGDVLECIDPTDWTYAAWGPNFGGPFPFVAPMDWGSFVGNRWMVLCFNNYNCYPAASPDRHGPGFMLDRFRLGIPLFTNVPDDPVHATRLLAPSPNPFNPATTIAYTLATPGRVTIRVHDIAGRVVRTLVDEERVAGEHAVVWDGTTDGNTPAASGVYFVRMESGGRKALHKEVRKLVLLK